MEHTTLIENVDPKTLDKPAARCNSCDREMTYFNVFVSPGNERRNICWECLSREEKGFNAHRGFKRGARTGMIPR